nr:MAG TPA: hypothetical protein [Caudoviricetes sp.]
MNGAVTLVDRYPRRQRIDPGTFRGYVNACGHAVFGHPGQRLLHILAGILRCFIGEFPAFQQIQAGAYTVVLHCRPGVAPPPVGVCCTVVALGAPPRKQRNHNSTCYKVEWIRGLLQEPVDVEDHDLAHRLVWLIRRTAAVAIFFVGMPVVCRAHCGHRFACAVAEIFNLTSGLNVHFETGFWGVSENNRLTAAVDNYPGTGQRYRLPLVVVNSDFSAFQTFQAVPAVSNHHGNTMGTVATRKQHHGLCTILRCGGKAIRLQMLHVFFLFAGDQPQTCGLTFFCSIERSDNSARDNVLKRRSSHQNSEPPDVFFFFFGAAGSGRYASAGPTRISHVVPLLSLMYVTSAITSVSLSKPFNGS